VKNQFLAYYDLSCPENTAAFGLALDGTFKCISVVDYCSESVYFSYVLDTSGSMKKGKLGAASSSGRRIIKDLDRGDMASVTTFSSSAQLRAGASTKVDAVGNSLNGLRPRGSTNISEGMQLGGNTLSKLTKGAKVIVLLSDGMHNTGTVDPVDVARSFKDKGYRVFSIGFGEDADRTALRQMASSPVDFFAANDANDLKKAFDSISSVICRK
jgi:Ca-activated chloride channel family protein